jgi:hypothetical protein
MLNRNEFSKTINNIWFNTKYVLKYKKLLMETYDKLVANNNTSLNMLQDICMKHNVIGTVLKFINDELGDWANVPPYYQINEKNYALSVIKDMLEDTEE